MLQAQRSTQAKLVKLASIRALVLSSLVVENVGELECREYEMSMCVCVNCETDGWSFGSNLRWNWILCVPL